MFHGASMNETHPAEIPGLTGLRFLAAFSVLIAHGAAVLMHGHERLGSVPYWVTQVSGFGMTLFFVLSGFVIHYNYAGPVTAGSLFVSALRCSTMTEWSRKISPRCRTWQLKRVDLAADWDKKKMTRGNGRKKQYAA
jgi:hypothetical protein